MTRPTYLERARWRVRAKRAEMVEATIRLRETYEENLAPDSVLRPYVTEAVRLASRLPADPPASPRERCCVGPVTQPELMASIERLRVASRQLKQHERLIVQEEIEEVRWLAEKLGEPASEPPREAFTEVGLQKGLGVNAEWHAELSGWRVRWHVVANLARRLFADGYSMSEIVEIATGGGE